MFHDGFDVKDIAAELVGGTAQRVTVELDACHRVQAIKPEKNALSGSEREREAQWEKYVVLLTLLLPSSLFFFPVSS